MQIRKIMSGFALIGLLIAGCGGDDSGDGGSTGGASATGGATSSGGSSSTGGASSSGGASGAEKCAELGTLCHDVDDGDGELAACHELGHAGDPDACEEQYEHCKTLCEAAANHGGAGGAGHAAAGGAGGDH